jgi:uncharacterized protein
VHVVEIRDAELMAGLTAEVKRLGITNGAIASLIGAVDRFTVSTMREQNALDDVVTEYNLPAEMIGTGEIVDGTVHVHAVMAVEGDRSIGGHLHLAAVGTFFARAYIIPAD